MYFNFTDDYIEQYNLLDNLHKRISLQSNKEMYNIKNEYFFEGQKQYLYIKKYDFLFEDNDIEFKRKQENLNNIIKVPLKK